MPDYFAKGGPGYKGEPGCTKSKPAPASADTGTASLKTKSTPAEASCSNGTVKLQTKAVPARTGVVI